MNSEQLYNNIKNIVSKNTKVFRDEPMSKHTSFKIGGNADVFVKATNIDDIKKVLNYAKENQIQLTVVGNGSNLLVKDNGIRGITLRADINNLNIDEHNQTITVGSGVTLTYLAQIALKENLEGMEFASGIPGTIGGAIRMNAGAHGKEMKDLVIATSYIDTDGKIHKISNEEHEFEYRNSIFSKKDWIILGTKLQLKTGNYEDIKNKMTEYLNYRKKTQPIEYPSAGSTFKRGEDFITAKLIDDCGLKGYNVNDAEVSTKHAGFVINKGNAKASDVIELTMIIKQKIKEKYDKDIKLEVQIIGE